MGINRGKDFEKEIQQQLEKLNDTTTIRLYDVTTGYKNQNNICDFVVYRKGTLNLLECKALHGNTLNFKSDIRKNQWDGLLDESNKPGVNAGILIWFIDRDETYFVDIQDLDYLKQFGNKSFNPSKDLETTPVVELIGKKKRVFFEYDLEKFLEDISYE